MYLLTKGVTPHHRYIRFFFRTKTSFNKKAFQYLPLANCIPWFYVRGGGGGGGGEGWGLPNPVSWTYLPIYPGPRRDMVPEILPLTPTQKGHEPEIPTLYGQTDNACENNTSQKMVGTTSPGYATGNRNEDHGEGHRNSGYFELDSEVSSC